MHCSSFGACAQRDRTFLNDFMHLALQHTDHAPAAHSANRMPLALVIIFYCHSR